MLEQLRRNSRSVIVWALFGIIIFIFVVSFGPQADQLTCGGGTNYAVRVDGNSVQPNSWRFGMNSLTGVGDGQERRQRVIDQLVAREILAQAGEDTGLRVSDELVREAIAHGEFYILGQQVDGRRIYFTDDIFDYDAFSRFSRQRGISSAGGLIEEQRREHLANKMRSLLVDSVSVSRDELRARFIQEGTQVTVEHASFDVSAYERALALSERDLDVYLEHHGEAVEDRFEQNRRLYRDVSPQVEVRYIVARAGGDREAARAAADRALERIRGGASFAEVARSASDDEPTAHRGGYMGWRPLGSLGLGSEVSEATETLEVGEVSDVIEGDDGFYVVTFEGDREGDLDFEDVKYELARELARPYYAREAARRDARAALERVAAGEPFAEVFPERTEAEQGRAPFEDGPPVPAQLGGESEAEADSAAADDGATISDEPIPEPTDLDRPAREVVGPLRRQGEFLEGIGQSQQLVRALFDELSEGDVAERLFELDDAFVIAKLVSREQADMDEFEERIEQLRTGAVLQKSADLLFEWLRQRCGELTADGRIQVNPEYFRAPETEGEIQYTACRTLSLGEVARQLQSQMMPR